MLITIKKPNHRLPNFAVPVKIWQVTPPSPANLSTPEYEVNLGNIQLRVVLSWRRFFTTEVLPVLDGMFLLETWAPNCEIIPAKHLFFKSQKVTLNSYYGNFKTNLMDYFICFDF